jgi:hypothetical protein
VTAFETDDERVRVLVAANLRRAAAHLKEARPAWQRALADEYPPVQWAAAGIRDKTPYGR